LAGDDRYGYEKANERWLPIHTVETILISVISMLADPNDESPANVDAAKEWRDNYPEFKSVFLFYLLLFLYPVLGWIRDILVRIRILGILVHLHPSSKMKCHKEVKKQ
jgi:hypothetical protein